MNEVENQDIVEGLIAKVLKDTKGIESCLCRFPRMAYEHAMNFYGSDKPDTRFEMNKDLTATVKEVDFKVFSEAPVVKAIVVKGAVDSYSRKDIDKLTDFAKQFGAKGLAWVKVDKVELAGPVAKFLTGITENLTASLQLEDKDLVLL